MKNVISASNNNNVSVHKGLPQIKSKPLASPISDQCIYDQVLSRSITETPLAASISKLDSYNQGLEKNRKIQRSKRVYATVVALLAALLALYELIERGRNKQSPTEILYPLMSLAKKCKVVRFLELEKLFKEEKQQTVVSLNYKEALGISGDNEDEKILLKIADVAADFHAHLAKLERDFEDLPETDPTLKKLTTPKIKAKGNIAQSVSPLVVKRAIQRLKDLRKRLPKVAINNVFSIPKSKLEDIEIVLNIDEILAIHFERTARHIEATIPQMSQTQSKKYLDEFLKIRIQVGIPLSKTAQEMIDLLREP